MTCICCSGLSYEKCCKPFHQGTFPASAVQLMRSRYAGYALNIPHYIIETTHLKNPQCNLDHELWIEQIHQFSKSATFHKLEILDFQEKGEVATVTFIAHLSQNGKDATFTEKSHFEKVGGRWLYLSGQLARKAKV
ncbi:MAG: hypothetical protein L0207_05175 [Chlamydiae bacterium]|nr:hypothetical protein [Chlamydiota bacterium]